MLDVSCDLIKATFLSSIMIIGGGRQLGMFCWFKSDDSLLLLKSKEGGSISSPEFESKHLTAVSIDLVSESGCIVIVQ